MSPTNIEWATDTLNMATGCTKVSPGCDNCYMFALYPRWKALGSRGYEKEPDVVQLIPERMLQMERWKRPRIIFVNSMSDTFHPHIPYEYVTEMFAAMFYTDRHIYQILTKRPGRVVSWWEQHGKQLFGYWPPHIWIGTSVENQKYAPRIDVLARVPAPVRFVSAEPLLGPLDLSSHLDDLQWVIVGGESGPSHRPIEVEWVRELRDQSLAARVPYFFKQWGGKTPKSGGRELDGRTWDEMPVLTAKNPAGTSVEVVGRDAQALPAWRHNGDQLPLAI